MRASKFPWFSICTVLFMSLIFTFPAYAKRQKFIYVYDNEGQLLKPSNAAKHCPDPNGGVKPAEVCHGVAVKKGKYKLRFNIDDISQNNLVLVANEYEIIKKEKIG